MLIVVNVGGKDMEKTVSGRCWGDERQRNHRIKCRNALNGIKTELSVLAREKFNGNLKLLVGWCPAHRWHELNIGFLNGTFELVARILREKPQGKETEGESTEA